MCYNKNIGEFKMFTSIINVWYTIIAILACIILTSMLQFFVRLSYKKNKKLKQCNFIKKLFFYHIKDQIPLSLFIVNFILLISILLLTIIGIINIILQNLLTSSILSTVGVLFFVLMFIESIIIISNHKS